MQYKKFSSKGQWDCQAVELAVAHDEVEAALDDGQTCRNSGKEIQHDTAVFLRS